MEPLLFLTGKPTVWTWITDVTPWIITAIGTIIAWNKDFIATKFSKKTNTLELHSTKESIESQALQNVEATVNIYRGMVTDLKTNITELKTELLELKDFIREQKEFIARQSKSLSYYEKKHGKIIEEK
ncbi:hypothetical protein LCGC14_1114250 [marine sediment metagenome]|uniref:Uncharacterized protein n=2 Tax=root TaxID=1 RepID=A0A831QQS8_9FLAO|nr:hypothetical protein [Pricia sp.]HEA22738.1 hypothetical protein [Pricia antarctica]